ncbi:phage holin family protein [Paracoccus limosus]|jgi:hypothetical protein|uniref:Phage holin family protein n=1 Tax=Paracoccus limosus TaxID=913252 RepID=A0A844HB31_9RHOB|nr:phage holin family protein [Paracoccus limosus]MTH36357.1 phage holin family protein [Paracoccus limosus]
MFAYTRNMRLALSDRLRRAGLAGAAAVVLLLAAGFLLAALWTWLAHGLGWGPLRASLVIGGALAVIGLILLALAGREKHRLPSTDELKTEVEQQLHLMANTAIGKASDAADAALERASDKASHLMDRAEQKVHAVADDLGYRANRFADQAEARVYGTARQVGDATAQRFGFTGTQARAAADRVRGSNAAALAPVLGALAVGITLATRLQDWRHRDDPPEDDDDLDDGY